MAARPTKRRRKAASACPGDASCPGDDSCGDCDAPAGAAVAAAYAPAYAFGGGGGGGPQCSEHADDFCFFCAYEKDPNAEAGSAADLYGSLVDLVNSMTRQKKEFPAIVDAVATAYESQIRPFIDDPVHGSAPAWLPSSIERHLTYSNQFGAVFDGAVTQVFHSLVAAQNATMVDATTGHVIEENRKALMSTLDSYMKWQRFQSSTGGGAAKR